MAIIALSQNIFMNRFPFTAEGFALMQSVLYAYDDSLLTREAKQAATDFLGWMVNHFEIDVMLLKYLRSLPETSTMALGMMIGACLAARIPIYFEISDSTGKNKEPSASATYTFFGKYVTAADNLMRVLYSEK